MKRLLAIMLGILILMGPVTLLAEPDETGTEPEPTATGEPTADPTAADPTATEPEPTETGAPPAEFVFVEYSRYYDDAAGTMAVTWNYAEGDGTDVIGARINGRAYSVTGSKGRFSVKTGSLGGGTYSVEYVLWRPNGDTEYLAMNPLTVTGAQGLNLSLTVEDQVITATLTDSHGQPVAQYPLTFVLNDSTTVEYRTNQYGQVTLSSTRELTDVDCTAAPATVGGVSYEGASASWQTDRQEVTTTPTEQEPEDDQTTTRSRWSATQPTTTSKPTQTRTYATITGAGTTAVEGDRVAVNATFDEGVPEAFGLKADDFHQRARLLVSSQLYADMVGSSRATLMLTLAHSDFTVTDQQVSSLVSGRSKYSRYDEIQKVAVAMGLEFLDEKGKAIDITVAPHDSYLVRLPVPESMMDCPVLAVAVISGDKLTGLTDVEVRNGYLEFEINGMAPVAILGFGEGAIRAGGGVAWQLLVLMAAGILLLAAAGTLMYLFVWRKPAPAGDQPDENEPDENEPDENKPDGDKPFTPNFMLDDVDNAPKDDGIDLYSSSDRRPGGDNA